MKVVGSLDTSVAPWMGLPMTGAIVGRASAGSLS